MFKTLGIRISNVDYLPVLYDVLKIIENIKSSIWGIPLKREAS